MAIPAVASRWLCVHTDLTAGLLQGGRALTYCCDPCGGDPWNQKALGYFTEDWPYLPDLR